MKIAIDMGNLALVMTNNPEADVGALDIIRVNGSFYDVLIATRDYIHQGYRLISHPLGASSRMMLSPYRSIIIERGDGGYCEQSLEVIESSITQLASVTRLRSNDQSHADDYAMIDNILLQEAIKEHARLRTSA